VVVAVEVLEPAEVELVVIRLQVLDQAHLEDLPCQ
tara:strand:+ start:122 stop:226 length:105 start_codon:yes stop_codon:yes gene_type:complete